MAIAIIGMAPDRVIPDGYELWGMTWDYEYIHFDRLFDLHDKTLIDSYRDEYQQNIYWERLRELDAPLYMKERYIENAIKYPFNEVSSLTGEYFACSVSYMIGLAMLEGTDKIGVFGVSGEEDYGHQKASIEYMIGFARGLGIEVEIQENTLLKPIRYGYVHH